MLERACTFADAAARRKRKMKLRLNWLKEV
jgi:hypothetical protein